MRGALDAAYKAQDVFRGKLLAAGAEALERLDLAGELGVVLVGRPYNMYDKGINMDIPRKLRKFYGVNVIPLDFLPIRGIDIDPDRAQHVLELRAQDPPGRDARARHASTCTSST